MAYDKETITCQTPETEDGKKPWVPPLVAELEFEETGTNTVGLVSDATFSLS